MCTKFLPHLRRRLVCLRLANYRAPIRCPSPTPPLPLLPPRRGTFCTTHTPTLSTTRDSTFRDQGPRPNQRTLRLAGFPRVAGEIPSMASPAKQVKSGDSYRSIITPLLTITSSADLLNSPMNQRGRRRQFDPSQPGLVVVRRSFQRGKAVRLRTRLTLEMSSFRLFLLSSSRTFFVVTKCGLRRWKGVAKRRRGALRSAVELVEVVE